MISNEARAQARHVPTLIAVAIGIVFLAIPAAAQTGYSLDTPAGPIEMAPQLRQIDGIPYANAGPFIEAAAGGQRIAGTTAQIDLKGATAWVDNARERVSGSRGNMTLNHAPYVLDGALWIAVADLIPFFQTSFDVRWTPIALSADPVEDETEVAMVEDTLSPFDLDDGVDIVPTTIAKAIYSVVIDPGHGGADKGAIGAEGTTEANAALVVAKAVAELATPERGFTVALTRSDDRLLSHTERVRTVEEASAKLVVSIHAGEALTPTAAGYSILYSAGAGPSDPRTIASKSAAEAIGRALTETTDREVLAVRGMPLRVAQGADVPAVLVVVGSLNNPAEERLLADEAHRARLADGLAKGIAAHANAGTR